MSKINKRAITEMESVVERKQEDLKLQYCFPEIPEPIDMNWRLYFAWGDSVTVLIPLDFPGAYEYRDYLVEDYGWEYQPDLSEMKKDPKKEIYMRFYKKGEDPIRPDVETRTYSLKVMLVSWLDGGTCQKVQIGTEIIEKPIYELVCNEGAKEETFEDPPGFG